MADEVSGNVMVPGMHDGPLWVTQGSKLLFLFCLCAGFKQFLDSFRSTPFGMLNGSFQAAGTFQCQCMKGDIYSVGWSYLMLCTYTWVADEFVMPFFRCFSKDDSLCPWILG